MRARSSSPIGRLRLAWLLCLALVLPFAQLAAAAHELSHLGAPTLPDKAPKGTPHADACASCVSAAALGTGATAPAWALLLPRAIVALSAATAAPRLLAGAERFFESRAPPAFLP